VSTSVAADSKILLDDLQSRHQREIAQLEATVAAMRDALEAQRRQEEARTQAVLSAHHDELRQVRLTVQTLREALEAAHRATDEAVQAATRRLSDELAQMRDLTVAMRDALEAERAENLDLRQTIHSLRETAGRKQK